MKQNNTGRFAYGRRAAGLLLSTMGALLIFSGQSAPANQSSPVIRPGSPEPRIEGSTPAMQLLALARRHRLPASAALTQAEVIRAVVAATADRYGVPRAVALGLSGHESGGWKMWRRGEPLSNSNLAGGELHSTDWGVMQINDRAHPAAFPRAATDLAYNVEYGLRFLAALHPYHHGDLGLGFGTWDLTLAAYHLGHAPQADEMEHVRDYVGKIYSVVKSRLPVRRAESSAAARVAVSASGAAPMLPLGF